MSGRARDRIGVQGILGVLGVLGRMRQQVLGPRRSHLGCLVLLRRYRHSELHLEQLEVVASALVLVLLRALLGLRRLLALHHQLQRPLAAQLASSSVLARHQSLGHCRGHPPAHPKALRGV